MRAVIDYRPALRERSGVGEYTHQLASALLRPRPGAGGDAVALTLFSSSWKDRFTPSADLTAATVCDRRIPVSVLNFAWHRLEWPTIETLTGGQFDVTHSLHPLMLPSRTAARVITIHDLNFLAHPERTRAEIRRDYPALARSHARRADRIIVPSQFTAGEVERQFGVSSEKIAVCSPGAPAWPARTSAPPDGYILFFGTLEPRKNVGGLLDAYERLVVGNGPPGTVRRLPDLLLAGKATAESQIWLDRIGRAPLQGRVRHIGYVDPANRRALYDGARLLVQPSFEEGFGIPVLEAMTRGVPVVAARRGALPEVLGGAGLLIDPDQPENLASAIARLLDDPALASDCTDRGVARAGEFNWDRTARLVSQAYLAAIEHRRCASA